MKYIYRSVTLIIWISFLIMVLASNLRPLSRGQVYAVASDIIRISDFFGLTQGYQMFAVVGREGTKLKIEATDKTGKKLDITQPLLMPDGFFNKILFNHKSGKFIHNIVLSPNTRKTYLDYLCRHEKDLDQNRYQKITFTGTGEQFYRPRFAEAHHQLYGETKVSLYLEQNCEAHE